MRSFLWALLKPILFRLDAESAHRLSTRVLRIAIRLGPGVLRLLSGHRPQNLAATAPRVLGMEFQSRVGLAAGFDKDAELLAGLPHLGFGFAEIGTVTPRPQDGNPRPRLFRDPETRSLFNRMGFNGLGAELVSSRLRSIRPHLPARFRVGLNIGKNKDTPLEEAHQDYLGAVRPFRDMVDYVVINVSSPNTPGLRSLQTAEALAPIIRVVRQELSQWQTRPPLLLKLAPEVDQAQLAALLPAIEALGIEGWVLTNTLGGEWTRSGATLSGGWSGGKLTSLGLRRLREARSLTRLPIISVGGILTVDEGQRRIEAGADLVQIYSGWVFNGPGFPARLSEKLRK